MNSGKAEKARARARKKKNEEPKEEAALDWRDYIAFIVALLESSLLPFVVLIIALIIVMLIMSLLRL